MIREYIKKKWEWVDKNPRLASWLGWFKGLITGLLAYYIIDNQFQNLVAIGLF